MNALLNNGGHTKGGREGSLFIFLLVFCSFLLLPLTTLDPLLLQLKGPPESCPLSEVILPWHLFVLVFLVVCHHNNNNNNNDRESRTSSTVFSPRTPSRSRSMMRAQSRSSKVGPLRGGGGGGHTHIHTHKHSHTASKGMINELCWMQNAT